MKNNGSPVQDWVRPQPGNLLDRLSKLTEPAAVADELYLSVYTRRPAADEAAAVAEFLTGRDQDRMAALQELVWALLASVEFRFAH